MSMAKIASTITLIKKKNIIMNTRIMSTVTRKEVDVVTGMEALDIVMQVTIMRT
jgi:hypothetical protein